MYALGMILYQILFKLEPFYERHVSHKSKQANQSDPVMWHLTSVRFILELLEMIALSGSGNEQIIRPSFPKQTNLNADENYNLQLLSAIEACWLELPEMRPNIKRVRTLVNGNLRSVYVSC